MIFSIGLATCSDCSGPTTRSGIPRSSMLVSSSYTDLTPFRPEIRPVEARIFAPSADFMKSAEGAKILASTGRISGRKGVKSVYEELTNMEERGIPLLVVGPEQSEQVAKPMEKIMKEMLVP